MNILLNYKLEDLNLISKIIIIYLENTLCEQYDTLLYYDYWMKINSNHIKSSGNKIQFIFININRFINYYIHSKHLYYANSIYNFMEFDKYNQNMDIMNCIFDLLSKFYDLKNLTGELLDFDNTSIKNENIIIQKNKKDKIIVEKDNNKKTKPIIESDYSDSETKYSDYSDSDNSDIIYKKAVSNSSKRTKKIIKKGL